MNPMKSLYPGGNKNIKECGYLMEKMIYDVLEILNSRIDYYDCLIRFDKADIVEFEITEELKTLKKIIEKLEYSDSTKEILWNLRLLKN